MNEEEQGARELLMRVSPRFNQYRRFHVCDWRENGEEWVEVDAAIQAVIEASHPDGALLPWDEFMTILGQFLTKYPPDVFDGSSDDVGPRVIVLLREAGRLHSE